jgi:hypothetical protein
MQIWMVLIGLARNRQLITYEQLRLLIGFDGLPHYLATPLGHVMDYCHQQGLPALTVLVVNNDGVPGPGLIGVDDVDRERERVFSFGWYRLPPVQVQDLANARQPDQQAAVDAPAG